MPEQPRKDASLVAEELEGLDEMIYVRPSDGASFSLNMTAASVLEWCDGSHSPAQITDLLADSLAEALPEAQLPDKSRLEADVKIILRDFADKGLIR